MATRTQKLQLGIFLLVAGALAALTLVVFAGLSLWDDRVDYQIDFVDSVHGLEVGAPVKMNGISIGRVEGYALTDDPRVARVFIAVDDEAPVKTDSTAALRFQGITGLKYVEIEGGSVAAPPLPPGSEIPTQPGILAQATAGADEILDSVTALVQNLERLTRADNVARVERLLDAAEELVRNVDARTARLTDEVTALARTSQRAVSATATQTRTALAELEAAAAAVGDIGPEATQLLTSARRAVNQVEQTARRGDDQVRVTLQNLRTASASIEELARALRARPSRLLFDNHPEPRELP